MAEAETTESVETTDETPEQNEAPQPQKSKKGTSMASKSKANRSKTLNEMPVEELAQIRETLPEVSIKVVRRGPDGRFQSIIPSEMWSVQDILEGKLMEYVQAKAGGGRFVIEVRDPSDVANTLVPRWEEGAMGPPRDPKMVPASAIAGQYATAPQHVVQHGPGGQPALVVPPVAYQTPGIRTPQMLAHGQVSLPPQDEIPAWAKSYGPEIQWKVYYESQEQKGKLPPGASIHSDAIAQGHATTWQLQASAEKAENAKLRAELDAERARSAQLAKETESRLREIEKSSQEAKHRAEMDSLRAEIRAMAQAGRPTTDWGAVVAGLSTLAGAIVPAVMQSSSRRYEVEANREIKHLELTTGQQTAMLAQLNQKPTTDWTKLIGVAVPLVAQYLQSNGLQARAEVEAMRNEQNLLQAKMVTDLLLELRGSQPEEPAWYPLAQGLIEALPGLGRAVSAALAQRQGHRPPPRELPSQPSSDMAGAPPSDDESAVWAHLAQIDGEAAQQTQQIWAYIPPDSGFRTHEWRNLIFNMHMRVQPDEMADYIVDHLTHLARHQMLPRDIVNVFDEPELMREIISAMPVAKADPEYATRLADTIVQKIEAANPDDETEEVVEAPGATVEIEPTEAELEDEEERSTGVGGEQGAVA